MTFWEKFWKGFGDVLQSGAEAFGAMLAIALVMAIVCVIAFAPIWGPAVKARLRWK